MRNKKTILFSIQLLLLLSVNADAQLDRENIKLTNISHINTTALDFSPVFYHHGLVYVSSDKLNGRVDKNIKENTFDLLYTDMGPKGKLSKPLPFSLKVNTGLHEGPVSFSSDMKTMYFTRNNIKKGQPVKDIKGVVRLKIYESNKGNDDWENIKELPFNSDQFSCVHPALSGDGQFLYFASDRPGGEGGMDLYYVKKLAKGWSEPINLGPEVNTKDQEVFPYVHTSGKLFFSSNRKGSRGGLDIYTVDFKDNTIGKIEKLPVPINSVGDDLGLILSNSGEVGYFSSDRSGGQGKDDIYRLDINGGLKGLFPPKEVDLLVKIFNKETSKPLVGAKVILTEIKEGKTIYELSDVFDVNIVTNNDDEILLHYSVKDMLFKQKNVSNTNDYGKTSLPVRKTKQYVIAAANEGFKTGYTTYTVLDANEANFIEIGLMPIPKVVVEEPKPPILEVGSIIVLDQIYYDFGKSYIRTDASKGLDAILALMIQYPEMTVGLTSHTDSRGTDKFNLDLSMHRSASAKYYLTSRGIAENRIKVFGKGEQNPRNRCIDGATCTEEEYQFNRRSEIEITSLGPVVKTIEYINNAPEYIDRAKFNK